MSGLVGSKCTISKEDKVIFRGEIVNVQFYGPEGAYFILVLTEKGKLICYSTNEMYRSMTIIKDVPDVPFR